MVHNMIVQFYCIGDNCGLLKFMEISDSYNKIYTLICS